MKNTLMIEKASNLEAQATQQGMVPDSLRFASGPAWEAIIAAEPVLPLPRSEWEKVSDVAHDTLDRFREKGLKQALVLGSCMRSIDIALDALQNQKEATALLNIQNAEVTLSRAERIAKTRGVLSPKSPDTPMYHGCALATKYLKHAVTQCLRGIIADNPAEFIRARVSVEDAAMCLLAARHQMFS